MCNSVLQGVVFQIHRNNILFIYFFFYAKYCATEESRGRVVVLFDKEGMRFYTSTIMHSHIARTIIVKVKVIWYAHDNICVYVFIFTYVHVKVHYYNIYYIIITHTHTHIYILFVSANRGFLSVNDSRSFFRNCGVIRVVKKRYTRLRRVLFRRPGTYIPGTADGRVEMMVGRQLDEVRGLRAPRPVIVNVSRKFLFSRSGHYVLCYDSVV